MTCLDIKPIIVVVNINYYRELMPETKPLIYTKLALVMAALKPVEKDGEIKFGSTNYSYQSVEGIVKALRQLMIDNSLIMFPISTDTCSVTNGLTTLRVGYRFVCTEDGSSIDVVTAGQGQDSGDKGSNKAMSGALKYALKQVFMIEAGEDDPDKTASPAQYKQTGHQPSGVTYVYKEGIGKNGKPFKYVKNIKTGTTVFSDNPDYSDALAAYQKQQGIGEDLSEVNIDDTLKF